MSEGEIKSFMQARRQQEKLTHFTHENCTCSMEASDFLQSQHALLEVQARLFELDVISAIGDFFHHEPVSWQVEHRNDAGMVPISLINYIREELNCSTSV